MRKSEYPKEVKTLGEIFRKKRMDMGLSLLGLANKIKTFKGKLTESYLSRIEANKKVPSVEVGEQIAKELKIDPKIFHSYLADAVLDKTFAKTSSTSAITVHSIITPKKTTK